MARLPPLSFGEASVAQVIKMMEFQGEDRLDTLIIMLGTNDVSRAPVTPEKQVGTSVGVSVNELKESIDQARDPVYDTAKSFGGYYSCGFYEWQRNAVE